MTPAKNTDALADAIKILLDAAQIEPQQDAVFISYAWADDKPFVEKLHKSLTDAGITVWRDEENIRAAGNTLRQEIKEGIVKAARFMPVIGPEAAGKGSTPGTNINLEWEYARQLCKSVMPVLREGKSSLIPPDFYDNLWFDFRDDGEYDTKLAELLKSLEQPADIPGRLRGAPWLRLPPGRLPRTELIEAITTALHVDDYADERVVAIQAPGGMGKSVLATLTAMQCKVRRGFPDGIVWVEVGRGAAAEDIRTKIGAAFGIGIEQMQQPAALTTLLSGKDCLIILDDVWEREPLARSITPGADVRYLVTTRSTSVIDLPEANWITLEYLTDEEGAELIARRLGADVSAGDWSDRAEHLAVAHELGGHVQAIAICAARLDEHDPASPADLLAELQGGDSALLEALKRDIDDESKEGNFLKSFSLSYEALREDMQRRFRQLGVLAEGGSFSVEMAEALWGEENGTARILPHFVKRALLEEAEGDRYALHTLTHAAACTLLKQAGEYDSAFDRYIEYVIKLAEGFDELPIEEWHMLEPDFPHVDHIGDALVEAYHTNPNGEKLQKQVEYFVWNSGNYVRDRQQAVQTETDTTLRGLKWIEMGLSIAQETNDKEREAFFLNALGYLWSALGEKRNALKFYEQALPLRRAVGDRGGEATTLNNIGGAWSALGEKRKALEFYEQALPVFRAVGDRGGEATTLNNIGGAWSALGEKRKALEFYQQALPLSRAVGDRGGEAATLNNIGGAWHALGETRKALEFYEQALPLLRAVGDRGGEATTLHNIGGAWSALGETRKALEFYEQALPLSRAVGDRGGEATTLNNIGLAWDALGEKRKALEFYEQALPLSRAVGDHFSEFTLLGNISLVYADLGDLESAVEYIEQSVALGEKVEHPQMEVYRQVLEKLKQLRDNQSP